MIILWAVLRVMFIVCLGGFLFLAGFKLAAGRLNKAEQADFKKVRRKQQEEIEALLEENRKLQARLDFFNEKNRIETVAYQGQMRTFATFDGGLLWHQIAFGQQGEVILIHPADEAARQILAARLEKQNAEAARKFENEGLLG